MARRCRTRKGRFTSCRGGAKRSYHGYGNPGRRSRRRGHRRSYRGYGQPLKVFSGFGRLGIGMDAFMPPLLGGGAATATALILRGAVDPFAKDEAGQTKLDEKGVPVLSFAFKNAGYLGAGAGVLVSGIYGAFWGGWGSAISGGITALAAGLTAQFFNSVMKEENKLAAQPYLGYGLPLGAMYAPQRRNYGRFGAARVALGRGMRGYGAIGATPVQRRFALPGRGIQSMPQAVLANINTAAFGGRGATLGTRI